MISRMDWTVEQAANHAERCIFSGKRPDDQAILVLIDEARRSIAKSRTLLALAIVPWFLLVFVVWEAVAW